MTANWEIMHGDCLDVLATLAEASSEACVTDPPYHLTGTKGGRRGFSGQAWDGGDVAFRPETWAAVARVLKPGAHLLAFGGTRTFHRLVCAIEDAGFEVRDAVAWLYGSGFPKSMNIGDGWGTALKPGLELICLARKPFAGTVAANVKQHGTGALNIEGCKLETHGTKWEHPRGGIFATGPTESCERKKNTTGRWPANVCLDEEAAAALDEQSGKLNSGDFRPRSPSANKGGITYGDYSGRRVAQCFGGDSGGASRFFYTAKASVAEREAGLEGLPAFTGAELTGRKQRSAGLDNPRAGAGRTAGQSALGFGDGEIKTIVQGVGRRNQHPTVKPAALMQWLVRLVTPPGGTVLDPFTGSGTTGIAALREGFSFLGIEQSATYCELARARIVGDAPLLRQG